MADRWQVFIVKSLLGEYLSVQGKREEAEPLLVAGYDGLKICADQMSPFDQTRRLSSAIKRLITHYESVPQPEEARPLCGGIRASDIGGCRNSAGGTGHITR